MPTPAATLAQQLAAHAEAVCKYYLSKGRRCGRYWLVGDVHNTPGRSLYVRLAGPMSGRGAAGKWSDAATGQHGDLLDLIALNLNITQFRDVLDEARDFLGEPRNLTPPTLTPSPAHNATAAARRLFAASRALVGSLGETYLRHRGITADLALPSLRFHPDCWHRPEGTTLTRGWPAIVAAVTDNQRIVRGVHRTWLARDGLDKAPLEDPRRAMGELLGHAVRFGPIDDVMIIAEGLETALSLRSLLPHLPVAAALSAAHLAAFRFPYGLKRLYIAVDYDAPGCTAATRLAARASSADIAARLLVPPGEDWNDVLRQHGSEVALAALRTALAPIDSGLAATERSSPAAPLQSHVSVRCIMPPDDSDS